MGFQTLLIAFVADLLAANRKLLEDVRYKLGALQQRRDARPTADERGTEGHE
jgi:hypothetical protein